MLIRLSSQVIKKKQYLFKTLIIITLVLYAQTLSGSQISQKCHCDLSTNFCDFGCCCDTDCRSSISLACSYQKSSYYCPKIDFFKSIKSSNSVPKQNNCFYFNKSSTLIDEKSLSSTQLTELITTGAQMQPISKLLSVGYQGYKINSALTIGSKNAFSFVSISGDCISTSTTKTFSLKFGQNTKISCNCNSCGTPLLFSDILGKSVPKYFGLTGNDITIPQDAASSITKLKVNFIIGQYGSQKIKYIQKITTVSQTDNTTSTRTLIINFIDSVNIKQQELQASFFPQIPIDMFYPIHIMS